MMVAAGCPPRNSATAEVLVTEPITIMKMAGGTSMPIARPARDQRGRVLGAVAGALERRPSVVEPSAETSAIFEPQMSEKKYDDDDHRHAEPAAQPADHRAREVDQRVRNAAALHQPSGEDEGRDGEQDPALRATDALEAIICSG